MATASLTHALHGGRARIDRPTAAARLGYRDAGARLLMIWISSSGRYPSLRPTSMNSLPLRMSSFLRDASSETVTPRPRRNSSRPSSRSVRSARSTVFGFTQSTAARSRAGGRRSPGLASPSATARRIAAATCSCSATELVGSIFRTDLVFFTARTFGRRCLRRCRCRTP